MMCCMQCPLRDSSPPTCDRPTPCSGEDRPSPHQDSPPDPFSLEGGAENPPGLFHRLPCITPICPRLFPDPEAGLETEACLDCPHPAMNSLCRQDAYVLTFLSRHDEFALASAHHTLDSLARAEHPDLLVELFHLAPNGIRQELWERLALCHPGRLHLLNGLFEACDLPPLEPGEWPDLMAPYSRAALGSSLAPPRRRLCRSGKAPLGETPMGRGNDRPRLADAPPMALACLLPEPIPPFGLAAARP